ncbi:hypothetical protein BLM14_20090 (plasmid) [Phyllobacterium zundukense]|uniref:hypothetical protein n=1 Tax=Phyllobacterium zundukense TaxID=1867719 RepID=UPI000C1BA7AF|nr:hypothetical protein [Phyllobacterium zundukense]ATU94085.1 hypothetical protein BLM14_20090 [Phyllobacterium zundukense]
MLRNFFIILTLVLVSLFIFSMLHVEKSLIASKLNASYFEEKNVSEIILGEWDIVCPITETTRPRNVLSELGYGSFDFSKRGNVSRDILFDGETGLVLINLRDLTYSLFLVFDRDKIEIIPSYAKGKHVCWPYSSATLVRNRISTGNWLYLSLLGAGQ